MSDVNVSELPVPVRHTYVEEAPVLSVSHLSRRFGAGCPYCDDSSNLLERNICPRCGAVHAPTDVDRALATAREFGLFVTGGSDYHGRYGAPAHVGVCFVTPAEAGEAIDALFAREVTLS